MNAERLRRIETLYRAVLESGPEKRSNLLAQAEPGVRREVESLLEQRSGTKSHNDAPEAAPLSCSEGTGPAPRLQLGPYRIGTELGKGGMGQVFRAHDTRLGRDVAIKFCTEEFSERFQREARAIAALNHPHICTLHDVGRDYLVMELLEGQTLARRVERGTIPAGDAIAIARQIAAALEAAHDKGIVHRDLKPGNVMLKPDGTAKVLDFGLAKIVSPQASVDSTLTIHQRQSGVIVGTAAYMAPEQVRGEEIDKRADIWAFGVVLYEMLTGTQPFQRKTLPDTLTAVLTDVPDWQRVPGPLQRLVRRCLQKNPIRRLRDIGDARIELEELTQAPDSDSRVTAPDGGNRSRKILWIWLSMVGIALSAAAAVLLIRDGPARSGVSITRTTILLPPNQIMNDAVGRGSGPARHQLAVSPDGQSLVYVASTGGTSQLFIRGLAEFDAKPIPQTDGANFPIFSPDGRWVAFFANYRLQKVSISGGAPITICDVPIIGRGASWGPADTIIFSA
jgi:eukaryotic-like serine/threonine-protein kinase